MTVQFWMVDDRKQPFDCAFVDVKNRDITMTFTRTDYDGVTFERIGGKWILCVSRYGFGLRMECVVVDSEQWTPIYAILVRKAAAIFLNTYGLELPVIMCDEKNKRQPHDPQFIVSVDQGERP